MAACGSSVPEVPAADTVELEPKDVVSRVSASATIDSREVVALTTALTGPVTAIDVRVGQPVQEGQVLARVDTTSVQRELDTQRAQQMVSEATSQSQLQAAQQELNQKQEAMNRGLNPQIAQAQAAQRDADAALSEANASFQQRKAEVDAGLDARLFQQGNAVDAARRNITIAGLASVRANAVNFINALTGQVDQITPVVGILETDEAYKGARRELADAQRGYEIALHEVDADLEAKQRAVGQAYLAKSNADVALEVARLAAQQDLQASAAGVEQAQRGLDASRTAGAVGQGQLQVDLQNGEVRSPINGVVTNVVAQRGQPSSGHLLTVADPERLLLTTNVNEVDSGRIKVGNEVTFTTPSTGMKEFRGRVEDISPVAAPSAGGAEGPAQTPARPEFPVTIEVIGDKEGLRIGGSAKAQIVTGTARASLSVPRETIIDDNGKYSLLTLRDAGEGEYEVTEVPVTLGLVTDLEVQVKGVDPQTRVLKNPGDYRSQVGQRVRVPSGKAQ